MKRLFIQAIFFFSLLPLWAPAQSILDQNCELQVSQVSLSEALKKLSDNCGLDLVFSERFFKKEKPVSIQAEGWPVKRILDEILAEAEVNYREVDGQIIFFLKVKKVAKSLTISGYVEDAESGERLIAATVYCPEIGRGTTTNEYGFFSLTLPQVNQNGLPQNVVFSYIGYQETVREMNIDSDLSLTVGLSPSLTLAEVVVTPQATQNDLLPGPGPGISLAANAFPAAPDMGGESDLLRMVQLLPGVQSGADGFGGINVRGGDSGQNLVLLDGVPVYNPAHLLGLLSIFNTAAVKNAQVITSGIPARYGGRLSSVIDVRTKEGSSKKRSGEAGVDFISAKGSVEMPFAKGKGTLLLAVRKTVSDFLLADVVQRTIATDSLNIQDEYRFSDFNWKVSYQFSDKNRWYFSYYRGWDDYSGILSETFDIDPEENILVETEDETQLTWGNHVAALRWNHVFNPRVFSNTTLTLSKYQFMNNNFGTLSAIEEELEDEVDFGYFFGIGSEVLDVSLSSDYEVSRSPNHYLRFGFGTIYHALKPEQTFTEIDAADGTDLDDLGLEDVDEGTATLQSALEFHWYFEDEFKVGKRWHFNTGLRLSGITGEQIYLTPEPRLRARYRLNDRWKLTAAIDRTAQYLHRLTFNEINLPSDVWIPVDFDSAPERSWQGTIGASGELDEGLNLGVEAFGKTFRNVRSFAIFQDLDSLGFQNEYVPSIDGTAYGLEFFLRKTGRRTGGWLSYTWSKADRKISEPLSGPEYAFQYDRRHDLKIFLYHRLTERWQLGLNWVYGSPQPRLYTDEDAVPGEPSSSENLLPYPFRQPERLAPYHRLDLSAAYSFKGKFLEHTFKLSAYNLYDRKNVAFYRFSSSGQPAPVRMLPRLWGVFYGVKF